MRNTSKDSSKSRLVRSPNERKLFQMLNLFPSLIHRLGQRKKFLALIFTKFWNRHEVNSIEKQHSIIIVNCISNSSPLVNIWTEFQICLQETRQLLFWFKKKVILDEQKAQASQFFKLLIEPETFPRGNLVHGNTTQIYINIDILNSQDSRWSDSNEYLTLHRRNIWNL